MGSVGRRIYEPYQKAVYITSDQFVIGKETGSNTYFAKPLLDAGQAIGVSRGWVSEIGISPCECGQSKAGHTGNAVGLEQASRAERREAPAAARSANKTAI